MIAPDKILNLPMNPERNDAQAASVREYLIELLTIFVEYGEDAIKRPFGNSGWEYDLYEPLVRAGLIEGEFDEETGAWSERPDFPQGRALLLEAIKSM